MSNALVTEIRKIRVGHPIAKGILLYLAECHNAKNGCFPSQLTIARELELSNQSVRRYLLFLETGGFIKRNVQSKNGKIERTYYEINTSPQEGINTSPQVATPQINPSPQVGVSLPTGGTYLNRNITVSKSASFSNDIGKENSISPRKTPKKKQTQEEWLETLKNNEIYAHVNFERELGKAKVWIDNNPGRVLTKSFFTNWINKIEPPLNIVKPRPVMSDDERKMREGVLASQEAYYGR